MTGCSITCWAERSFSFEPQSTALIVIDMQRHFLELDDDEGTEAEAEAAANDAPGSPQEAGARSRADTGASDAPSVHDVSAEAETAEEQPDPREVIPRVGRLLAWARSQGCYVVHTREGYSPDLSDVSSFRRDLDYVGHDSPLGRTLIRGEAGHDFVDDLRPLPGETVIDKASFGAFYDTDLEARLRQAGVTHVILCGVTTQCCVHSTLREAVDRGFWCLTVADCCAAAEPELHEAALMIIMGEGHLFGWIAELADVEASTSAAPVA